MFYLSGYNVLVEDLKSFCKLNSKILGYFEFGYMDGVEVIIGFLG